MSGIDRITKERQRQIEEEGWSLDHDEFTHGEGQLRDVAVALAMDDFNPTMAEFYPPRFGPDPWGLCLKHRGDRIRQLEIAGALIAAEIDRLERK